MNEAYELAWTTKRTRSLWSWTSEGEIYMIMYDIWIIEWKSTRGRKLGNDTWNDLFKGGRHVRTEGTGINLCLATSRGNEVQHSEPESNQMRTIQNNCQE